MRGPLRTILANAVVLLALCAGANAQDTVREQLSADHFAVLQTGTYIAGDDVPFSIDERRGNYLLRFEGEPEVYVLYPDRASLGGRIFKYDSGETAMQVTVWGGITIYTDGKPNGLPAARTGDSTPFSLPDISIGEVEAMANVELRKLDAAHHVKLEFTTDWNDIENNAALRAIYFDAMENALRGIDRFVQSADARKAVAKGIATVSLVASSHPSLRLARKILLVTFNPNGGYQGRASSRAIARALSKVLKVH